MTGKQAEIMDEKKIMEGVRLLLEGIGEDPMREGLLETPQRIARMYQEIFAGLTQSPAQPLSKTFHTKQADLVLEKDIQFYATCEHHLLRFTARRMWRMCRRERSRALASWRVPWTSMPGGRSYKSG